MINGMHERVGNMHGMQIKYMSETCGPPIHADHLDMQYQPHTPCFGC